MYNRIIREGSTMVKNQCMIRIQSAYPHLSEKERLIADYILNHPEETVHSSINQVSARLNVADATVFRFCRRLEFKGFQEMKIILASDIARRRRDEHGDGRFKDDEVMQLSEKVFQNNIRTLENTFQILNSASFKRAVAILTCSEKVVFFGSGDSCLAAQDAYRKFVRAGIPVYAPLDGELQRVSAGQLNGRDAAVFIAYSDDDRQLVRLAKLAKAAGCPTIGLTGFLKSALGETVDVSLHTVSVSTEYRQESSVACLAQSTIIDALYVNIMKNREKMDIHSSDQVSEALLQESSTLF